MWPSAGLLSPAQLQICCDSVFSCSQMSFSLSCTHIRTCINTLHFPFSYHPPPFLTITTDIQQTDLKGVTNIANLLLTASLTVYNSELLFSVNCVFVPVLILFLLLPQTLYTKHIPILESIKTDQTFDTKQHCNTSHTHSKQQTAQEGHSCGGQHLPDCLTRLEVPVLPRNKNRFQQQEVDRHNYSSMYCMY